MQVAVPPPTGSIPTVTAWVAAMKRAVTLRGEVTPDSVQAEPVQSPVQPLKA